MRGEPAAAGMLLQRNMLSALVFVAIRGDYLLPLMRFRALRLGLHGFAQRRRSPPHYRVIGMLDCRDRLLFDANLEGPRYVVARTVHGSGVRKRQTHVAAFRLKRFDITAVEAPERAR